MKSIKSIIGRVAKVVGLLTLGLTLTQAAAQAATIKFQARVPGYTGRGDGWVLVRPELRGQLGGKVIWDNARNSYVTDRIARGETMRVSILASTPAERCYKIAFTGIAPNGELVLNQVVLLPYVSANFGLSTNPNYDNVIVTAWAIGGSPVCERIPIGSR